MREPRKGRVVHPVQRTTEVLSLDEEIGFAECRIRACYSVLSKRVRRVHNGMLSRTTFSISAEWFRRSRESSRAGLIARARASTSSRRRRSRSIPAGVMSGSRSS